MKRLTPLDMNKNEVQNMRLQSLAAAPGSPVEALIYYNSNDKKAYIHNGTLFMPLTYVHPNHSGDVTSSGDGATTIANKAVTYAKMQDISATDRILGRSSAGAGVTQEITCTAAGRALLDDADAAAQRTTLQLGTMSTETAANYVAKALFDAQTILAAVADNTPVALVIGEQTIIGRKTGGNIAPLTAAEVRAILNVADGANNYVHPNHTGDVTSVADGAQTIANNAVTLAKMADMATASLIGRNTAGSGDPEIISMTTLKSMLGLGAAAYLATGTASGNVVVVGGSGKIDASLIPASAITDVFVVASQVEMLALSTAGVGDIAVRTDLNKSFILKTEGPSVLANWQELLTPTDVVTSVAGKTGAVTLVKADVGLANVDNKSSETIRSEITSANVTDALGYTPPKKYAADIGNGALTSIPVTHSLNTTDVVVSVKEKATNEFVMCDIVTTDANTVTLSFSVAPTAAQYRVVVIG